MLSEEIAKIKADVAKRQEERDLGNIDSAKEDEMLANLSQMPGWEVLKAKINKTINDLLEPGIGQETASLETIGAITIAREFTIDALNNVISEVETTKSIKLIEKQEAATATEESEPVA
jgi:hypothetical protein